MESGDTLTAESEFLLCYPHMHRFDENLVGCSVKKVVHDCKSCKVNHEGTPRAV